MPTRRSAICCACVIVALSSVVVPGVCSEPIKPIAAYGSLAQPLLTKFCSDCHTGDEAESGFATDRLRGDDDFQLDRKEWKELLRRLRAGDMPPVEADQPSREKRQELIEWITLKLDLVDCSGEVNPGQVTLRRLNRDSYQNTVRDLLGIEFDATKLFPPDELAYGFDNNGDALTMSPLLVEKYVEASQAVARQAIAAPEDHQEGWRKLRLKADEGLHLTTKQSALLYSNSQVTGRFTPVREGRYYARFRVSGDQAGGEPVRMAIHVGNSKVKQVEVWNKSGIEEIFVVSLDGEKDKPITLGAAFINDFYQEVGKSKIDRNLYVHGIEIVGPLDLAKSSSPRVQRTLLQSMPSPTAWQQDEKWQESCRVPIAQFTRRAHRRDIDEAFVDRLLRLMESSRAAGDSYERALQQVVTTVLASPRFLMIGDLDRDEKRDGIHPIDEFALASRMSYFLWGSMPDDELLDLASRGKLRSQLDRQVRRMLRDQRVQNFARSFSQQWLETRQLTAFKPDPKKFPQFNDELRIAMQKEVEKYFAAVVIEDLPIQTLLSANFTYANEPLAKHYGLADVSGNYFRRVEFGKQDLARGRGGILGMASVLAVTSNPDRTSPVLRGKFVLSNLLGDEPPPPPPDVPELGSDREELKGTIREQLEAHRENPGCAACHNQMDPLGFALERFDALGRFRETDGEQSIDDSAELPDGTKISGADGLRDLLLSRDDVFRRVLAEKMLTYALGRGLEYYDECAIREIAQECKDNNNRFSSLVLAIVQSRPFQFENRTENRQESTE